MDTVLLVLASVAALTLGVLSAYGYCLILFGLLRVVAQQQRSDPPAKTSPHALSA